MFIDFNKKYRILFLNIYYENIKNYHLKEL